ncbi:hypothetical protein [Phaeobacter sp. 22II1-1F12B]|uniref:hypothetical protein n=1 Tax=Phaeobacter sp. 22II1-1F12B TaxID=1317111 RepID=UPI001303DCC6|nr:hypothetical protein [Phaeobacter sp. 22II1-1F12B]
MITRLLILGALLVVAACEKEKGVGFTGVGSSTSRDAQAAYALVFSGLTAAGQVSE